MNRVNKDKKKYNDNNSIIDTIENKDFAAVQMFVSAIVIMKKFKLPQQVAASK